MWYRHAPWTAPSPWGQQWILHWNPLVARAVRQHLEWEHEVGPRVAARIAVTPPVARSSSIYSDVYSDWT